MSCNCGGAQYDLCIQQGATFNQLFTWSTLPASGSAVGTDTTPVNLTGYSASLQIRPFPLSTTLLYDASANITLGGAAGTITLSIPAGTTEGFSTWWSGVYDLLLTDPSGNVTRLLAGTVTVSPGVTT
jgi:hypothetical protein